MEDFGVAFDEAGQFLSGSLLLITEEGFQVLLVDREMHHERIKLLFEGVLHLFKGCLSSLLADVGPSTLDTWDSPRVDRGDIGFNQLDPVGATDTVPIDLFGAEVVQDLLPQLIDLLHKLLTELLHRCLFKVLKLLLVSQGTDHRLTLPLMEVLLEGAADCVLLIIGRSLFKESAFQIFLR